MLFKTIVSSIRSSPFLALCIAMSGLAELLFHYVSALSYKYLVDRALLPKDASVLAIIVGALLVLGLLNVLLGIAGDYAKARFGSKLLFEYRSKLFKHMQLQSHRFYRRFPLGDLLARYTDDIPNIQFAVIRTLTSGFVSLLSVVIGLAILFGMEWRLTLIAIGGSFLLFLPYRLLKARSLELNEAYSARLGEFTGRIDENVRLYKEIRGFDLRRSMLERVEGSLSAMLSIGVKRSFVHANLQRLPMLALSILGAVILSCGSYLTFADRMSVGSFIAYNSVFITVGQSLFGLMALLPYILNSKTSFERLNEVLNQRPEVEDNGVRELPAIQRELSLRGVSFAYDNGAPALSQLDMSIPATGYTSIVGPSGSGKSTLLQLLLRFEDPGSGEVLCDGEDIRDFKYSSLLRQAGVVFQDSFLFSGTIRDNIRIGKLDAEDGEVESAAKAAGIHDTIAGFQEGYDTAVHANGENLSGGQRQRIALARALIRNPKILFLDEATSALDPESEQAVMETIAALSRSRAVISVTHRLANAARSDLIIVLEQGRAVETGTHERLLEQRGLYRRMWDMQHAETGPEIISKEAVKC